MKKILFFAFIFAILVFAVGCSSDGGGTSSPLTGVNSDEMFTERDRAEDFNEAECVKITLKGDTAEADSDSVRIADGQILITEEADYLISGELNDGSVIVNAGENAKLRLILSGASISSDSSAAICIVGGDKVFITLAKGSENSLSSLSFTEPVLGAAPDAALYSKQDLTLNGEGKLTVTSKKHGISCKDDLVITGGSFEIDAEGHCVDANDSVRIDGGNLTLSAGTDGIHCENSDSTELGYVYVSSGVIEINAGGDGISAGAFLQLEGGEYNINASGTATATDSYKGLKAANGIIISAGDFVIKSKDDAVHSNTEVYLKGGELCLETEDDGIHADELLEISAGTVTVSKSYEGLEALDVKITGGEISLVATDDGINAAGGVDGSGFGGGFGSGDAFGGPGRPGGQGGHGARPGGGMGGNMNGAGSEGSIVISGGSLYIEAYGDGIDANGSFEMSGGEVTVCGPNYGDTATLDYDLTAKISGGLFVGTGASGMAQTFSESSQGLISLRVGTRAAGETVKLTDKDGRVIAMLTPKLSYSVLIISAEEIKSGEKYTLSIGDTTAEITAD